MALGAALLLTGCSGQGWLPYAREMGDMALVRTMGVDGTDRAVELTVSTGSRGGGVGADRQPALVLSADGPSISAAGQTIQGLGDTFIYYGYVDQLLLGEELAVRGVNGVLDHLGRDAELGLGVQVWVVRGGTARQALQSAGDAGVPARLEQLQTDGEMGAANIPRTAGELMTALAQGGSTYLPALKLLPAREGDGGEGGEYTLICGGYAVVRQGRLVCFVDGEAALGVELMEERVFGRVADVVLSDGTGVALRVDGVRVDCRPVFRGEELTGLTISCRLTGQVTQAGRPLTREDMVRLERKLERLEGERMAAALGLSQYWDADFLGLKSRAAMAQPSRSGAIEAQWDAVFRALEITVEMEARVEQSGVSVD